MELQKNLKNIGISAILFFAVSMPFRKLFLLLPVTEVRPASALPVVFGLLYGPFGAIGTAVGNLIADIFSGYSIFICIMGSIVHFFYSYLSYQIWYSFGNWKKADKVCFHNIKNVLKYIGIVLLVSVIVNNLLMLILEATGFSSIRDYPALLFFLNNFDFGILLGIPMLIFFINIGVKPYRPNKRKKISFKILFILGLIYIVLFIYEGIINKEIHPELAKIILYISFPFLFLSVKNTNIPIKKEEDLTDTIKISIKERITVGILLMGIIYLLFVAIIVYQQVNIKFHKDFLRLWNQVYLIIGISIIFVLVFSILFLWYIEKTVTTPIETLSIAVKQFLKDEKEQKPIISISNKDEIGELAFELDKMMEDILNYIKQITIITAEKERITAELELARYIQKSTIPNDYPAFPDKEEFDIYATMEPAKEIAGDFYDFFLVGKDKVIFLIADVSGKGIPAALFMMKIKTMIKNLAITGMEINKVFEIVNTQLSQENKAFMFVTAFIGCVDLKDGVFEYVNAGHNFPLILEKGDKFYWLDMQPDLVLGVDKDTIYHIHKFLFCKETILFLYTDGVTESINIKQELYSENRLIADLNAIELKWEKSNTALQNMIHFIKEKLDEFSNGTEQADDITMLVFQFYQKGIKENEK